MKKLILKSYPFFLCYFIFLLIGGIIILMYSKTEIFLTINQTYHYTSDYFFKYFTHVGDGIFYGVVIIALMCYRYKYAIIALMSFLLTSITAQALKRLVFTQEFRPLRFFKNEGIEFRIIEGIKLHSNNSFPSGHATTAFSIFCLLVLIFPDKKYSWVFFFCALLASYSRIYVGQHFFADVYFGSVLGVAITLLIFYFLDSYFAKLEKAWPNKNLLNK